VNHLLRSVAPITDEAWAALDREATDHLLPALGARRMIDFSGPHGWKHSATDLGRVTPPEPGPADGVVAAGRRVLPLVELRAPFRVARAELANIDRGAVDPDLDELDQAAQQIAIAENSALFTGFAPAGIVGITEASPHPPIPLGTDCERYPAQVAKAAETLLAVGIGGPYALALSLTAHTNVVETTEHGGYPLFEHLQHILDGPIVRVPGIQGGVILSLRGGDFLLESGQDLSFGYQYADVTHVHLYLEESFSFRVTTPEAALAMPAVDSSATSN
jgi:uncharacterized linocin/CFP29 family protein